MSTTPFQPYQNSDITTRDAVVTGFRIDGKPADVEPCGDRDEALALASQWRETGLYSRVEVVS